MEMLVTATVLAIVASAVVPITKNAVRRQKEVELRRSLREIRLAIDNYKALADQRKIEAPPPENNGYPPTLEILVEGANTDKPGVKARFLRRLPVDPFTNKKEWGMRSITDEVDSFSWGGGNVFDVYSLSDGVGSNGVPYKEW